MRQNLPERERIGVGLYLFRVSSLQIGCRSPCDPYGMTARSQYHVSVRMFLQSMLQIFIIYLDLPSHATLRLDVAFCDSLHHA